MNFLDELPEGIEECNYSSPKMRQTGKNYPEIEKEIHGHIITGLPDDEGSSFCMNTDLTKNETNINTVNMILNGELEIPVYLVQCHGAYNLDISTITLENGQTHYFASDKSKYQLTDKQFVVNTTPLGSIAVMGMRNAREMYKMFNPDTLFKLIHTLLSPQFLETFK